MGGVTARRDTLISRLFFPAPEERLYRALYDAVRTNDPTIKDFSMDTRAFKDVLMFKLKSHVLGNLAVFSWRGSGPSGAGNVVAEALI